MNQDLDLLKPYPFEKLAKLKANCHPPEQLKHISLSIGEPKHTPPNFVLDALINNTDKVNAYPLTKGIPELRASICNWLSKRFHIDAKNLDKEKHVLPVNGTREAIFAFTQAAISKQTHDNKKPIVIMPNPFYQIYEGAALLAGAEPYFLPCLPENNFIPDHTSIPQDILDRCQLMFICSPNNPTGSITSATQLEILITLAHNNNFILASDECYSEVYFTEGEPPTGLLEVANKKLNGKFDQCVVFHSLSKRSNLPGMRSGFIAGDPALLSAFLQYRTYHGSAMPVQTQLASIAAWEDEVHTTENRALYTTKFKHFIQALSTVTPVSYPDASFYVWLKTPEDDQLFTQKLFIQKNITVLPGSLLSRPVEGKNPGEGYVRIALVATADECHEAANRMVDFFNENY